MLITTIALCMGRLSSWFASARIDQSGLKSLICRKLSWQPRRCTCRVGEYDQELQKS
jgi:hypothetical protein